MPNCQIETPFKIFHPVEFRKLWVHWCLFHPSYVTTAICVNVYKRGLTAGDGGDSAATAVVAAFSKWPFVLLMLAKKDKMKQVLTQTQTTYPLCITSCVHTFQKST